MKTTLNIYGRDEGDTCIDQDVISTEETERYNPDKSLYEVHGTITINYTIEKRGKPVYHEPKTCVSDNFKSYKGV